MERPAATMTKGDETLFTVSQAARLCGVTTETLRAWIDEGLVRTVRRPGGIERFTEAEVARARAALGFSQCHVGSG